VKSDPNTVKTPQSRSRKFPHPNSTSATVLQAAPRCTCTAMRDADWPEGRRRVGSISQHPCGGDSLPILLVIVISVRGLHNISSCSLPAADDIFEGMHCGLVLAKQLIAISLKGAPTQQIARSSLHCIEQDRTVVIINHISENCCWQGPSVPQHVYTAMLSAV